jgi:CheY-like chemotaxis protein
MPTVLVVDDDAGLRGLVRATLGDDYEVLEASDGVEAVALARHASPDLVLLDVRMPRLNGIQACARIKETPAARPRVVMITAFGSAEIQAQARAAGADAFLAKPYSPLALLQQVGDLLAPPRDGPPPPTAISPPRPAARTYRLFFAHAGACEEAHRSLHALLNSAPSFAWRDVTPYAIDPDLDLVAQEKVFDGQVRPAACVLVPTDLYRIQRPLLHAQVRIAAAYRKPIIAVLAPDAKPISPTLTNLVDAQVPWEAEAVVGAIRSVVV